MSGEEVNTAKPAHKEKKQSLLDKFDIPVENLSYEYIGNCSKAKELERIVRILRSGEEGAYPHLTTFAEQRLSKVKPESAILRVPEPLISKHLLAPSERRQLDGEIGDWMQQMRMRDRDLKDEKKLGAEREPLPRPAVRKSSQPSKQSEQAEQAEQAERGENKEKRLGSFDYSAWDKYDVDTELARIDLSDERKRAEAKRAQEQRRAERMRTRKETIIEKSLLTGTELSVLSAREREKGNEAFRAADYEEALQLYSSSIALDCDLHAYNNRAMAHIKLNNYDKAIADCNQVLQVDCMNLKALVRRGLALEHLDKNQQALTDFELALQIDPENKTAIKHVAKLRQSEELSQPVRLTIEEIYEDS